MSFNWSETIAPNIWMLKTLGIWIKENKGYNLSRVYTYFVIVFLMGGHNSSQLINISFVYSDINLLISMVFITNTNMLALFKSCVFIKNTNVVNKIFATLTNKQFMPNNSTQHKLATASVKMVRQIYYGYHVIAIINVIFWILTPILTSSIKFWELPFFSWYPFEYQRRGIYELMYLYQTISIWFLTLSNINVDSFFFGMQMILWVQCEILCNNLSNLNSNFKANLKNCIEHYEDILR